MTFFRFFFLQFCSQFTSKVYFFYKFWWVYPKNHIKIYQNISSFYLKKYLYEQYHVDTWYSCMYTFSKFVEAYITGNICKETGYLYWWCFEISCLKTYLLETTYHIYTMYIYMCLNFCWTNRVKANMEYIFPC